MVNPLTFSTPQAFSGGADFSQLGKLGDIYREGQDRAAQQSALSQLGNDPNANAQVLIQSGVPSLAQLGMRMQSDAATRAEGVREFNAQQTIRTAAEKRAQSTFDEDSPEARRAKLVAAGLNPNDPTYAAHLATGAPLPSVIQQHVDQRAAAEEQRAATKFTQEQQFATREGRLQAARDGELDITDPQIRKWVALGGDMPTKAKAGLGTPTYTRDAGGVLHQYQLSSDGTPVEVKFPEGQTPLGPGEVAAQKQEGVSMAKARAGATQALPRVADMTTTNLQSLQELQNHPGREGATGKYYGQIPDQNVLLSQQGIDFRNKLNHVKSQSFLSGFETLKGAGAISDAEGKAATAAINRLSAVTSEKEFNDAVKEVQDYYKLGLDRMRRAAKGDFSEHPTELRPADAPATAPPSSAAAAPVAKPVLADFMTKARAANPGVSDSELARYWKQKYGG